ncbi:MAG: type II 3-dehydroquinate dehydratase [Opitutaceae bacterium]|nr:type II 3-dehydroquinate dehydratase [Opitutaceae bacterium]
MTRTLTILNGPNLNLLGEREPDIYGRFTLADIESACAEAARAHGFSIAFKQTNHEGELVEHIQQSRESAGLILNAGAYTHTSVAMHDALKSLSIPIIEVHLSNIFAREPFRHHSYVSPLARGVICGLGPKGYTLAIEALTNLI